VTPARTTSGGQGTPTGASSALAKGGTAGIAAGGSGAPLVVGPDGALPLPWLDQPMAEALTRQRGHALLLHGAPGSGALPFALSLAQAWLCEARPAGSAPAPACGRCPSCTLVHSHLHPDLRVQMPATLRREHAWNLPEEEAEKDDAKRKPSRQIRVDEVRHLIDWAYKTASRGRAKVAVLHPAEVLNPQAANALLKTLEEPPPGTRLILSAADPALLLPTLRSRCQLLRLREPHPDVAAAWLDGQGVADAGVLLAACSGRPLQALALAQDGVTAAAWTRLPQALAAGQGAAALAGWPVPRAIEALHKLCHDTLARASGAASRFFPAPSLEGLEPDAPALRSWHTTLARIARAAEHPWNEPLLIDALAAQAAAALRPGATRSAQPFDRRAERHSPAVSAGRGSGRLATLDR
jgi:DNA polymerase III subunit delta'